MRRHFTIGEVLRHIESHYNKEKALVTHSEGKWTALSTKEFLEQVKFTALALLALGAKKGEKIGILAMPSARWTVADYAIMAIGAVSVPIFPNITKDNFEFEVNQTKIKKIFVGGEEHVLESHQGWFEHTISLDEKPTQEKAISYEQLMEMGRKFELEHPGEYERQLDSLKPEDIGTIIYTSGSTGVPKGAVHTQSSAMSMIGADVFEWDSKNDVYFSFLPLAHVFARGMNFIMTAWGIPIYYHNDPKTLGPAIQEVKPSVLIVVPRVLEKLYAQITDRIQKGSFFQRQIGTFALYLAHQKADSSLNRLFHPLMDFLVYRRMREALGGNLRIVVTGGAPLSPYLYHFFLQIGYPIVEGWGLTESCPVTTNRLGRIKIGTVGPPILNMTVKVSSEGELLVWGPMIMSEYYLNPEETKKALDAEGWLHTGDKGTIDSDGYVTIVGRIKEIFKTSTGEMIAPVPIEQALAKIPFIESAIVIAENRKFTSCLLVPNLNEIQMMKEKNNMSSMDDLDFLNSSVIKKEMETALAKINEHLTHGEKIIDYRFIPSTITIESGELTPTMKLKRDVLETKFSNLIESMYKEETE